VNAWSALSAQRTSGGGLGEPGGSPNIDPTPAEEEKRTGYLELFFDLVFVFAFTQVATLIVEDTSAAGLARAALIFALVWWAWSAYAWLTNAIDVENVGTRLLVLGATLAAFFMALAIPDAYSDEGAWFALAYFVVRVLQVALYLWGVRGDPQMRAAVLRLAPWFLVAPTVALTGGLAGGTWRTALWTSSIAIDVAGALSVARAGFRISPSHFAERYALIVIIALGESIVAVGVGAQELERDAVFAVAVAVAFVGTAAAWWAYFGFVQLASERALHTAPPERRSPLARDVYTFFHYPIVLGIIFLAVAGKKMLDDPREPLSDGGRAVLALGFALFLLGFVLARLRVIRRVAWERIAVAGVVAVAVLVLDQADALVLVTVAVLTLVVGLAVERTRFARAATVHSRQ
jgi:low temperature requirement protein LtrA